MTEIEHAGSRARLRWPIAVLTALVVAGGLAAWQFRQRNATGNAVATRVEAVAPALTVTAATPAMQDWTLDIEAAGAIMPWEEASIGTQVGGYQLIDVRVNVGDHVRKGQLLARFDPALLRADEEQLTASHEQAEANRTRAAALVVSGGISAQDAQATATAARTAAALLAAKRLQLRYTEIVAPDDGTISSRTATVGAVVPAAQELFRMIRQDRLEWRGELTATQLAQVAVGQSVALRLPDGSVASARIRQLAPQLNAETRLALVYADVARGSRARAGMYATGRIALATRPALTLPAECLVIRDGRSYVASLLGDDAQATIAMRAVTVGRRQGERIEVLEGLAATERVVDRGAGFLNDGDIVRVVADKPTPTP